MADNIIAPPTLPGQGQDSGLQQHMAEFNQTIGLTSPQDLASINTNVYDPRPSAIDIYNKVVGNPIIGSNPGARLPANDIGQSLKQLNDYNSAVSQRVLQTASANPDKTELMRTFTYNGDHDGDNFDRYYNSAPFKELGYNPYRNNEALYNNNMSTGDEFVRAAGQWPSLVMTGFNPFLSGEEASKRMTRAMAVGSSTKEGVTPFLINTGLNMGYTIGIGAQMYVETMALWGATAITGGLDAEVTLPVWAAEMGAAARKLQLAGETVETLSAASKASKLSQLKTFWNSSQYGKALGVIGESINPLENTWNVGKDIASGANALKFAGEAPGTIKRFAQFSNNFAEFGKDMIQIQAAVSEAKLEGGGVKLDVVRDLSKKFREENGYDPTGEELGKIENIANDEAHRTAFWNMPAIMWSNKFMYNTLFKPWEKGVKTGLMKIGEDIFFNKKNAFTAVSEGVKGSLEKIGKNLTTPSKWGSFGYAYLKQNSAEGIQENIQEAISSGAKAHAMAVYNNPDRASYEGYMGHFMNGMNEQFSAKGAETFAGGFVMGAMAHPFMAGPHWAAQQVWNNTFNSKKYADYKATRKAQLDATVNTLNEIYKDPAKYLAPDIVNAVKQGNLSHELILANLDNNRKKHEDVKFVSSYDHIFTAIRTGKFDIILDKFKEFKNFTPEEAAQAFTPNNSAAPLTAEQGTKAMTMLDDIVKRANTIKENYDQVSANFPNPHDPFRYPADSNERTAQTHAYAAWEEAKRNLIFAKTAFQDHEQRIAKLADTLIGKRSPIKGANAQDILTLMDREQLSYVTTALQQDIKVADRTTPEGRKIAKEKEEKLALLTQYAFHTDVLDKNRNLSKMEAKTKQQLYNEGKEGGFDLKYHNKELKKVFKNYINLIAGTKGNLVFDQDVTHAFDLIRDNYTLRDERASFVKSINILNTPKGFLNLYRGLAQTFKEIDETKSAFIKERIDGLFPVNTQFNNAANTLAAKAGVLLTPEYATKLLSELKNKQKLSLPTTFIDAANPDENILVEIGHPKFKNALDVWAGCILMIEDDIAQQAAKTATPAAPAAPVSTPITKDMLLANPAYDGIRDEISAVLDKMIKLLGITDPAEIALQQENLLKTNPEIASIIAAHNKKAVIPAGEVISEPSTITLTAAQQATIVALKPVIEKVKQATTDAGYVIDGEAFNNRVSNIVKEILRKQLSAADFKLFTEYSENEDSVGPEIMDKAIQLFESDAVKKETDLDKKIDMIFAELEKDTIGLVFKNEFTKKTLNTFKEALKTDFTIENFRKQLNKLKNIRSTTRGNTVDAIVRDYFTNAKISKPEGIDQVAFNNLIDILKDIRNTLNSKGEHIITDKLLISGEFNGKKIAGEMDILVITPEGKLKIYDLKTAWESSWQLYNTKTNKKLGHSLQLSLYKNMIEAETGMEVSEIAIIPITTKEDEDGNVTSIKKEKVGKVIYATPGSGKSFEVKNNKENLIDADDLLIAEIKKQVGDVLYKEIEGKTPQDTIYNFTNDAKTKGKWSQVYNNVKQQMIELTNEGKSILTGSPVLIEVADVVFVQTNDTITKNKVNSESALEQLKEKEKTNIAKYNKIATPLSGYISGKTGFLDTFSIPLEYKSEVEEYVPKTTITPAVINNTKVTPTTPASDIEAKEAKIEKRRQEDKKDITSIHVEYNGFQNNSRSENYYIALSILFDKLGYDEDVIRANSSGTNISQAIPKNSSALSNGIDKQWLKIILTESVFNGKFDVLEPIARELELIKDTLTVEERSVLEVIKTLVNNELLDSKKELAKYFNSNQSKLDKQNGHILYASNSDHLKHITEAGLINNNASKNDFNKYFDWLKNDYLKDPSKYASDSTELEELSAASDKLEKYLKKYDNVETAKYDAELDALKGGKSQVIENQADKLGYKSEDIQYGVSRTKTVKGSKLTFKDFPGTNAFVYKENGEFKFTLLSGPGNLMFYDYIPPIATSTISKEDAIQKGYDTIANEIIKQFEEEEAAKAFNVENIMAKIEEITTFDDYDTAFDEINKDMANQTLENQTVVNVAFNTKKEALMNTITVENLAQAKKRGYKIILESAENSNVKSGIFSNFTVNKSKGTVTVKSMLGTGSVTIKNADLQSQIKGITTMDVKEEEPVVVTKDTADKINDVNTTSSEIISSDEMQKAIADIKTQSAKNINDDFFNNLGCK